MAKPNEPNRWKGYILGAVGSAAGTWVMNYYWQVADKLTGKSLSSLPNKSDFHPADEISVVGQQHEGDESSTAAMGRLLYSALSGKSPNKETKSTLSYIVDYAFGMSQGGIYGAATAGKGLPDVTGGIVFGTALWLLADELTVSVLGLGDGPTKYSPTEHLSRWGAHLVYGLTTALTTQLLYKIL